MVFFTTLLLIELFLVIMLRDVSQPVISKL